MTQNWQDYKPKMCGYCPYMKPLENPNMEVSGHCEWNGRPVYRADFCHRPEEIKRHNAAMEAYISSYDRSMNYPARLPGRERGKK